MTTSAWPSSRLITPVTRSMTAFCSGLENRSSRLPSVLPETRSPILRTASPSSSAGSVCTAPTIEPISRAQVVGHPRHRGELHPVGLLVQADPEPEVVRVGVQLALDVHDVGRHEQQPPLLAGLLVEGVELAEHLRAEEAEHRAELDAGDPRADRLGHRPGRALLLLQLVDQRRDHRGEAVGVGLDPARTVDDQHGRGALAGDQAGVLADQRRGPLGPGAQLLDGVDRLGPADLRTLADEPGPHPDGEVPVDHSGPARRAHATHGVDPTPHLHAPSAPAIRSISVCASRFLQQPDPVGDDHERHPGAARVVGHAGQAVHAGERPGLRPDPAPGGVGSLVEAVRQRAGEAGDRQAGEDLAQLRVVRRWRRAGPRRRASRW